MAAPDPNFTSAPPGQTSAVLMGWNDAESEFRYVEVDASGQLKSTASAAPATGTITSVGDATSSTTILAANASRKGVTVFNDSTAILYLALSNTTASTSVYSVQIPASGYYELQTVDGGVYTGIIVGIWASDAGGNARVTELT